MDTLCRAWTKRSLSDWIKPGCRQSEAKRAPYAHQARLSSFPKYTEPRLSRGSVGGRSWDRTSDLCRVKADRHTSVTRPYPKMADG